MDYELETMEPNHKVKRKIQPACLQASVILNWTQTVQICITRRCLYTDTKATTVATASTASTTAEAAAAFAAKNKEMVYTHALERLILVVIFIPPLYDATTLLYPPQADPRISVCGVATPVYLPSGGIFQIFPYSPGIP